MHGVDFPPRDPKRFYVQDPAERDRAKQLGAAVDGMSGQAAFEILAPEGRWPGNLNPAEVTEVVASYRERHPADPLEVVLTFKRAGEA